MDKQSLRISSMRDFIASDAGCSLATDLTIGCFWPRNRTLREIQSFQLESVFTYLQSMIPAFLLPEVCFGQ